MKIALVTGASRGLGFEWCRQLAKAGFQVIATARDREKIQEVAGVLQQEGLAVFPMPMDVTDENQIRSAARWALERFGRLDLIVNNAGINPKDYTDKSRMAKTFYLKDLDAREMLEVIHINSLAPLIVVKNFLPLLQKSENPRVINISSWLGSVSNLNFGGHYGYVGSKNLLNVLNKSMALELRNENISCVNVNPGWVQTDMGGQKARFTAEQAVHNLLVNVLEPLTPEDSGKFFNFDGSEHPW